MKRGQVLAHGFVEGETAQPNNRLVCPEAVVC